MGRLPQTDDFPASIKLAIVPPPQGDEPVNVLLLLHGLGDGHESFTVLGRQMNLPETACIAIQGPATLLGLGGFHWGDDLIFDASDGGLDADAGFRQSTELLTHVVSKVLLEQCGYQPRQVVLFGFGQGGMAALNLVVSPDFPELGGVVSIGAALPGSSPASREPECKTPVLICAGSDQSAVTSTSEDKLKRVFASVEVKRYRRPGDHMPTNRDEMFPIMQFFSRRLQSTKGIPAGSVEIG